METLGKMGLGRNNVIILDNLFVYLKGDNIIDGFVLDPHNFRQFIWHRYKQVLRSVQLPFLINY